MKSSVSHAIESLHDKSYLATVDNDKSKIIYVPDEYFSLSGSGIDSALPEKVMSLIEEKITDAKSGDVILITNDTHTIKSYWILYELCGKTIPVNLYFTDFNEGQESSAMFYQSDVEMIGEYPMFKTENELIFFLSNIWHSLYGKNNKSTIKRYLDAGVWALTNRINIGLEMAMDNSSPFIKDDVNYSSAAIKEFIESNPSVKRTEFSPDSLSILNGIIPKGKGENVGVSLEKDGKYLFIINDYAVGDYDMIKDYYCHLVSSATGAIRSALYVSGFGLLFFNDDKSEKTSPLLVCYEKLTEYFADKNKPAPVESVAPIVGDVTEQTKKEEPIIPVVEEDFWEKQAKTFEEAQKTQKNKSKKSRKESFEITSEISKEEKDLAETQVLNQPEKAIKLPKRKSISVKQIVEAQKEKEEISNTTMMNVIPDDWDKVLDIKETSGRYNLTVGYSFNERTGLLDSNETQVSGMTIEEWNAYFMSHPEYAHLIDPAIGQFGGLSITKEELMKKGVLLFNPKTKSLQYLHEFLRGNSYDLIEQTESSKDEIVQLYGPDFYESQLLAIDRVKPKFKSVSSADPKLIPFIHPLDEVVVDFKLSSAANMVFVNSMNRAIMRAQDMLLKEKKITPEQVEDYGSQYQELSITIFFMAWLETQYGNLASYGIPNMHLVTSMYFTGMTIKSYGEYLVHLGIITDSESVTESDFHEAKDSVKRFVNDMFQHFMLNEMSEAERYKLEYAWNKRYNGYINVDIWKYPIFIRHSKYFKDRTKRKRLLLSTSQVEGIKFATINNSSVIAHEVGYGKSLISICYMSHLFETNQANNILVMVPKSLYVNNKWMEEVAGFYDEKRDQYLIGATPMYNVVGMNNFSVPMIFGEMGNSTHKDYSPEDLERIISYRQLITEIGGKGGYKEKVTRTTPTDSSIPTNAYNFRKAIATSKYSWIKIMEALEKMDTKLFRRSIGSIGDEMIEMINYMANFDLGKNAAERATKIWVLTKDLIDIQYRHRRWMPMFGVAPFKVSSLDKFLLKEYDSFVDKQLPEQFERDQSGQFIKEEGQKVRRPLKEIGEDYILDTLSDIHSWLNSVLIKMYEYGVYEYGKWKFSMKDKNIILATRDALENIGFSSKNKEGIMDIVKEVTTYQGEANEIKSNQYDQVLTVVNETTGEKQFYQRKAQSVLQKQLEDLMEKLSSLMTEDGPRGKFLLENLNIDGFILDEAHIAKKIFTNVRTNSSIQLLTERGAVIKINSSSHDIRGGAAPNRSLIVFGICQYIRSLGEEKPLMLLTATPFSNQPTEIFSMLSLVGIKQMRSQGISNIKNFFDLFLKETLKYDFNHSGDFIKRITVEDFRNKEMLVNLIWSVMDIKREATMDKIDLDRQNKALGDKPNRIVYPKLMAESSQEVMETEEVQDEDIGLQECASYGKINTVAVVNKLALNTCSIVDRNDVQKRMMEDLEKVVTGEINTATNLPYTFDDICPNASIFTELEEEAESILKEKGKEKKEVKTGKRVEDQYAREMKAIEIRNVLDPKIGRIKNGINIKDRDAMMALTNLKEKDLIFVEKDSDLRWRIYEVRKTLDGTAPTTTFISVTDQIIAEETLKSLSKKNDFGKVFKAMSLARAIALSPYMFRCNELPDPTPDNLIKYSPKIEYMVKAIESVKDYHVYKIPQKIAVIESRIKEIEEMANPSEIDLQELESDKKRLASLNSAREISGQLVYMNMIRFKHYSRDKEGKIVIKEYNIAEMIKEYLVKRGVFKAEEIVIFSSDTKDKDKQNHVKDFQDGKAKLFFGTPAMKEGVDLQNKATTLYVLTPDWNPTDMRQIEGRIWRRDNENAFIRVAYILLDQSIEVFIYAKLEEKSRRLQQIMKERNTIAELEEMSLDPNQTKVALASDPSKRADIVTKLCEVILVDKLNKINKSRQELQLVSDRIDLVTENIELVKTNYFVPFNENYPVILKNVSDHRAASYVKMYKENKEEFVREFSKYTNYTIFESHIKDRSLKWGLKLLYGSRGQGPTSDDRYLSEFSYRDTNAIYDHLNGLKALAEHYNEFGTDPGMLREERLNIYERLVPMRYSTNETVIDSVKNTLLSFYDTQSPFDGMTVVYYMTDEARHEIINMVNKIFAISNPGKDRIKEKAQQAIENIRKIMWDYVSSSPLVRPENFPPYVEARDGYKEFIPVSEKDFDAAGLIKQVAMIREFYYIVINIKSSYDSMPADKRDKVERGKLGYPSKTEIIPMIGLGEKLQKGEQNSMEVIVKPIMEFSNIMRDLEDTYLKKRGLKLEDLPNLLDQFNAEYNNVESKIHALSISRKKLVERFEKMNKMRTEVTVDQIVAKFAETNSYLEYKLVERSKEN